MRRLAIALAVIAASCSGGDADTTAVPTTVALSTTTPTTAPATTTTTSTSLTTSTTSTTTTLSGVISFTHPQFTFSYPNEWIENPDFSEPGVGFLEDHTALALPATDFSVLVADQEPGTDLEAYIEGLQDEIRFFVPDFRVLDSGEETIDGARSLWFEYPEAINGFASVIREQVALRDGLLVTFRLISPESFFETDRAQAALVTDSFRFS